MLPPWLLTYSCRSWAAFARLHDMRLNAKAGAVHIGNKDTAQLVWEARRTRGGGTLCRFVETLYTPVTKEPTRLFLLSLPARHRVCSLFTDQYVWQVLGQKTLWSTINLECVGFVPTDTETRCSQLEQPAACIKFSFVSSCYAPALAVILLLNASPNNVLHRVAS